MYRPSLHILSEGTHPNGLWWALKSPMRTKVVKFDGILPILPLHGKNSQTWIKFVAEWTGRKKHGSLRIPIIFIGWYCIHYFYNKIEAYTYASRKYLRPSGYQLHYQRSVGCDITNISPPVHQNVLFLLLSPKLLSITVIALSKIQHQTSGNTTKKLFAGNPLSSKHIFTMPSTKC